MPCSRSPIWRRCSHTIGFRSSFVPRNPPPDITPLVLAKDEVAFVGEAVAVVIAQTRYIAEDAAALVAVDYRPLSAVSDCRQALAPGAPRVHSARASNLLTEFRQSSTAMSPTRSRARPAAPA